MEGVGRDLMNSKHNRVRQDIEQLLRRARDADFSEPSLAGLKRRIQEQVNETVRMRVVADVIFTELSLQFRDG